MRARLEALLAAHKQPVEQLAPKVEAAKATIKLDFTDEPPDEAVGQMLENYKLLEQIGECGLRRRLHEIRPIPPFQSAKAAGHSKT